MNAPDFGVVIAVVAMAIPIIAIVGGITAGIVRTLGQQRLAELAHKERIAALEHGVDPSKLPPSPVIDYQNGLGTGSYNPMRRAHGLLIGGLVTLMGGISFSLFLYFMRPEKNVWAVGLVPVGIGVALLLSSWLVRPKKDEGAGTGTGGSAPR
jgi:hypothetical protein